MIQFKIQFKTKSGIFIQKNIHSIESRIFNRIIHSKKMRKIIQNSKIRPKYGFALLRPLYSVQVIDPLKWTEIGPTNDPSMISDEFETFGDNHFWRGQTITKIFVQKIIHFIKIHTHSKQILIF